MSSDSEPLSADQLLILIEQNQYNTLLGKVHDGVVLSTKEQEWLQNYLRRPAASAAAEAKPAESAKAAKLAEIAAFYLTTEMTVRRCEEVTRLPDVPAVPWHDPQALAAWYRAHYRSDLSKPPTKRDKLPKWLIDAQGKTPPFAAPQAPQSAEPAAAAPPEPAKMLTQDQMIEVARRVVAEANAAMERHPGDGARGAAYMDALKQLQMLEDRARKTGAGDTVPKSKVATLIDSLLSRIPYSLELDLIHAFPDFARVWKEPDTDSQQKAWAQQVRHFLRIALGRIVASRFSDRLNENAAA